ncbi:FRG domain-containing protein [Serratia nevei]|uniref:FRG domain-containing protein n=1 Tax=Serratia TaxID=613 RepID=UPI0007452150|nr:FRG domain-containing protein [Serratia marcescens]MBH2845000.1 FRG domain-containing protein [Serratia marcescens]MBH2864665.1 FRG domain-containing protein [Serratia marcescens]MBH2871366.1 FRG domain-containing protein [Serratia marcescens]MBI6126513.1 FRG domain-containing protein [Serratia marcescens]MBN5300895.1 FRG domain-containing protein [Serratia marcescens]
MDTIKTKLFGVIKAPSSLGQLVEITESHSGDRMNVYMWRGQGDVNWPIHSAAYRRLRVSRRKVTERRMRGYELELLKKARHQGYGYEEGRRLADFEVLAKLQHHGAATRLIDFSRNMLVALWFTCQSQKDKTGLLFGIHSNHVSGQEGEAEERDYDQIFLDGRSEVGATTWQPPAVTKRIAAQSAQFIYSIVSDNLMGSLDFDKEKYAYLPIAITPNMKESFLRLLEGTFDVRLLTLFPDLDGFCRANTEHIKQFDNDRW